MCRNKRESKFPPFSREEGGEHGKCQIPRKHGPGQFRIWAKHIRGFQAGQQFRVSGMTCMYFLFLRAPSDICCAWKKKKQNIREERIRKNWIKRDFPPRARYHLLKALKNPPLRKISLVQRGYNSSQSILQQFVKIYVRYSSLKQFLFFLISTNLILRSTPLFREISHRIVPCIPFPMMISFRFCYEGVVFVV